MAIHWVVLLPLLGSLPPLLARRAPATAVALAAALPVVGALVLLALQAPTALAGDVVRAEWAWVPAAGLTLSFRVDGLSWLFGMMILVIGLLIQLYARYYMPENEDFGRLYGLLALFMGAMLGLVLSGNLLFLVICWEATSLVSYLLIGFKTRDAGARAGALTALTVTAGGGLALLAGVLLLGRIVGSLALDDVLAAGDLIRAHDLYRPALLLILLGAFTKSAQFPFHFWLPRAMAAPAPVSAYLHSATMVKAGVFLLARLYPVLSGTSEWLGIVGTVGLCTLLVGAWSAMWQHDLKGLLAYSTISHLGLITLLFGFSTPMAVVAAVFHLVNHATFKASLFMAAGIIDHEVGTRDMRVLNGLWKAMPWTGALAIVAASAMAGVPLLNGFISKEMFFAEALSAQAIGIRWLEPVAATVAGAMGVAYSLRFIMEVFFGDQGTPHPKEPHEPPAFMRLPGGALALACLAVGIAPSLIVTRQLVPAVEAVLQADAPRFDLGLWHGVNLPLLMTVMALGGGIGLFLVRERLFVLHARLPAVRATRVFDHALAALVQGAARATHALENGSLQRYVALLVGAALVAGVAPLLGGDGPVALLADRAMPDASSLAIWGLLLAATVATTVRAHQPLTAVIAISVVGLLVALAFVRLAAPDLALTQLLVEQVTILLLLLALHHLPERAAARPSPTRRLRDLLLAVGAGAGSGLLAWATLERPLRSISDYYLRTSLPVGGGRNVVNVILVDFRGFDTLGEVAVLGTAAIGTLVVLDGVRGGAGTAMGAAARPTGRFGERHPLLLSMIARALLPLAVLMSVFVLLRGHDLPGGGFAAGLLTAVALIVQVMASGSEWTSQRLAVDYRRLVAGGLLLAAATGAASLLVDAPFLTSAYRHAELPLVGKVPLSSALAFDVGVYAVVVGATLLILDRLARLSGAGVAGSDATADANTGGLA
jgi:multicomponent K+:H+ antiporter subunit A